MTTHLSRYRVAVEVGGMGKEGGVKRKGRREAPSGVLPFVLLVEAFLFSFLLPFERRVKTK
jgi:hypothetical protein